MLVLLSCFLVSNISAQETSNENSNNSDAQEYMLDEVIVTGDSSLLSLRMEVYRAEEYKFEIFNSLNSTDEFDIKCKWYAPTGTRIKQWVCDVGYMKKARYEDARDLLDSGLPMRSDGQIVLENAQKTEALNKEMIALAIKHPELATAMVRANELRQLYKAERRKRLEGSMFRHLAGNPEPDENDVFLSEIDIWHSVFLDHMKGALQENIWKSWDSWCKNKLQIKSYQKLWESANRDKYVDEFKVYVNAIISGN